jgi:hypothetical protein
MTEHSATGSDLTGLLAIAGGNMAHIGRAVTPKENLGTAYENVTLHTSDGLELDGWYVPSRNGAAVIAFPGRAGSQAHARMLARHGYGVLLFDRRGEGASEGDPNALGWGGDRDIDAAVLITAKHGEIDRKTPEYLRAAGAAGTSWTVPKGGHNAGIRAMPAEYERRVVGFLDHALLAGTATAR